MQRKVSLGFNCVRLPFSLQLLYEDPVVPEIALVANAGLKGIRAMALFGLSIKRMADAGLIVVLNNHNSAARLCCAGSRGHVAHVQVPHAGVQGKNLNRKLTNGTAKNKCEYSQIPWRVECSGGARHQAMEAALLCRLLNETALSVTIWSGYLAHSAFTPHHAAPNCCLPPAPGNPVKFIF